MLITREMLQQQIDVWNAEERKLVDSLNQLNGAIQSFQGLIAQIDNESGAGEDIPAPVENTEEANGITENGEQTTQRAVGTHRDKVRRAAKAAGESGQANAQVKSKNKT